MTDDRRPCPAGAGAQARPDRGRLAVIALGLAGLLLPLLGDSYIGVIAQRAYIYWMLSAASTRGRVTRADRHRLGVDADLGAYTSALTAGTATRAVILIWRDRGRRLGACSASSSDCPRCDCAPSISP